MTDSEIQDAVDAAIKSLRLEQPPLAFDSVHERSTAHRLAVYFDQLFAGWNVDCEYDRDGQLAKTLMGIAGCDRRKVTDSILPDIIVHHRREGGQDHNLLVVEMKKTATEDSCDRKKLELLTSPNGHYRYKIGLYININGGRFDQTWYKAGQKWL